MRERRPGVWEIRVAAGTDPRTGRTVQKSVTFHGTEPEAAAYRVALASAHKARRSIIRPAPQLTVESLLERWLASDHAWKPSTRIGYASNTRHLNRDRHIADRRVTDLTPSMMRTAFARWEATGATRPHRPGRYRPALTGRPIRYVDPEAIAVDTALALPDPRTAQRFIAVDLAAALSWLATPGESSRSNVAARGSEDDWASSLAKPSERSTSSPTSPTTGPCSSSEWTSGQVASLSTPTSSQPPPRGGWGRSTALHSTVRTVQPIAPKTLPRPGTA